MPRCAPPIDPHTRPLEPELAEGFASMLHGITGSEVAEQWLALPSAVNFAPRLFSRPLLLVTADADELFSPDHYAAFAFALGPSERFSWHRVPQADHSFSRQRSALVALVVGWLTAALSEP